MLPSFDVISISYVRRMRGIRFYEVHTSSVHVGRLVVLQLEPGNIYDSNYVAVYFRLVTCSPLDAETRCLFSSAYTVTAVSNRVWETTCAIMTFNLESFMQ